MSDAGSETAQQGISCEEFTRFMETQAAETTRLRALVEKAMVALQALVGERSDPGKETPQDPPLNADDRGKAGDAGGSVDPPPQDLAAVTGNSQGKGAHIAAEGEEHADELCENCGTLLCPATWRAMDRMARVRGDQAGPSIRPPATRTRWADEVEVEEARIR